MKITGLFLALMMMASVCFAQQTATVYSRVVTGSVSGVIPETDGIDNISLQKAPTACLTMLPKIWPNSLAAAVFPTP